MAAGRAARVRNVRRGEFLVGRRVVPSTMASREKVTSAFAPDLDEVRAWLQKMIVTLRFVDLVTAVLALIVRMRDLNTELVAQLAHVRRARPRAEALRRLERQLVLPIEGLTVPAPKPNADTTSDDKKKRRGRHPGRRAPPAHLPRVPVFNRVPAELRVCPQCGAMMTPVSHSSCLILNVIPARVFVEERLDETIACPNDDTIVSASPPPQIVERGKLADTLIVEAVYVSTERVGDAVAAECVAAGAPEHAALRGACVDDARERSSSFGPQRADAFLAALAENAYVTRGREVQIACRELERLADARARVVQEQQQGVVALTQRGASIGLGEDGAHLLGLEVLDDASSRLLASERKNSLVLGSTGDIVPQQVFDEATDGGQPAIAGTRRVAPRGFEIVQEREDTVNGDVVETKVGDGAMGASVEKQEEETEAVSVGAHGARSPRRSH
jgi:hypothetical protein